MDGTNPVNARCRQLPAVDRLVEAAGLGSERARWSLLAAARVVLAAAREEILATASALDDPDPVLLAQRTQKLAARLESPSPRRVINATGVVLHTNLGRAPLAASVASRVADVARVYSDLEFDLEEGRRGSRIDAVREPLRLLSGAADALVVNNGAAALLLAVDTFAADREVVLSRGELIEIGGSFRLPEILGASRARLREVGTTNRTHLRDYENALGAESGLLLRVHRSCFEMSGFTNDVPLGELAGLARKHGLPLAEDRGSATLIDLRSRGIPEDPAWTGLEDGADLVFFSGDKLLGGPQAGVVLGSSAAIDRMRRNPLARALRVDKLTLTALAWTLAELLAGRAAQTVPVLHMLLVSQDELRLRAERLVRALEPLGLGKLAIEPGCSAVGGGALPSLDLHGPVVRLDPAGSPLQLARVLRDGEPAVLLRLRNDSLWLDPRTLFDDDLAPLAASFQRGLR